MVSASSDDKGLPWGSNKAFWYNLKRDGELFRFLSRWAKSPLTLSYRQKFKFVIGNDSYSKEEVVKAREQIVLRTNVSESE